MKKEDESLINSLYSKKKVESNDIDRVHYNTYVNLIIDHIREKERAVTFNEIVKKLKIRENSEFFNYLEQNNTKVLFDKVSKKFSLLTKYAIKDINELRELIKRSVNGVPEDKELYDSYSGVKNDIELLKYQNAVKSIQNDEKKVNVLFYRERNNEVDKLLIDKNYDEAFLMLRDIWKGLKNYEIYNNSKKYADGDNKKERKRRRNKMKIKNDHIMGILSMDLVKEDN